MLALEGEEWLRFDEVGFSICDRNARELFRGERLKKKTRRGDLRVFRGRTPELMMHGTE